jgi:phosphatidylserine/phosphatidylglycerophosphate/cardiolipin synthase-like enzyme
MKVKNKSGYLHAKAIVVDRARAWVGSVNGSTTSIENNREFGIMLNAASEVSKLEAYINADFSHPDSETWQESLLCKKDPPAPR